MRIREPARCVAAALLVSLSSCSFSISALDPKWDGKTEPKCGGPELVWLDRLDGFLLLLGAAGVLASKGQVDAGYALPLAAGGGLFELAAMVGGRRLSECHMARTRWWYSNSITSVASSGAPAATTSATPTGVRPWAAGVSDADQARALALYGEGNEAYVQRRYAEALAKYKQAIVYWDHPAIRFNMTVCQMELAQPAEARASVERSLAYGMDALGPEVYQQALAYRAQLDRALVQLTIDCPEPGEQVMLDGELLFDGPGRVDRYLAPGPHQVVANKRGFLPASAEITLTIGHPERYEIRPVIDPRP